MIPTNAFLEADRLVQNLLDLYDKAHQTEQAMIQFNIARFTLLHHIASRIELTRVLIEKEVA